MGGCCCCSSSRAEPNSIPTYYYLPRSSEEQVPLSTRNVGASGLSAEFQADTHLETSIPDTYQPPPAPITYDVDSGTPPTPSVARETHNAKTDAEVEHIHHADSGLNSVHPHPLGNDSLEADERNPGLEQIAPVDLEVELKKSAESAVDECPTCLEEYDKENPMIPTECGHHFHLACILEWLERSDRCPVCYKEMKIEEMFTGSN